MSQLSENKQYSIEEILEKLRSEAQKMPVSPSSFRYLRALESLESSVFSLQSPDCGQAADISDSCEDSGPWPDLKTQDSRLKTAITDWLVNQWLLGQPFSTASLYLDMISALYGAAVKAGCLPETTLFSDLKARLKQLGQKGWTSGINEVIFARALRLTKNAHRLLLDDSIAADLIILSLTQGLQPIQDLALLKRDDLEEATDIVNGRAVSNRPVQSKGDPQRPLRETSETRELYETIATRHLNGNGRRQYIFPLRQSERTPTQLKKQVFKMANALFRRARLPQATDPNHTVESLWAYAALTTGVPASTVVAHLGHAPLGLPVLKLCQLSVVSCQLSESGESSLVGTHGPCVRESSEDWSNVQRPTSNEDFSQIGKIFLDNPPRWYAMSLRPGVRFTQVCRRIQTLSKSFSSQDLRLKTQDFLSDIQLFYPCEEIARAIGKKIVIKQRPFIHSVVFFKAKLTDIGPLFARIGDLAWCYRQSARPGAPYAEISQQQFSLFQQTIATFTPDYEVASTGELELKKDDRVQIVGGLFAGHEARVEAIGVVNGREVSNLPMPSGHASNPENSSQNPEPTVYRLNIVGDNGIEWRVHVDPRVVKPD